MSYLRCPSKARALPARPLHSLVQWPGAQLIPTKVIWLVSLGVFAAEGDLWHRTHPGSLLAQHSGGSQGPRREG